MLSWAIGFFVAALVAALFGFGGIASAFSGIAVILFWLFVGLLVVSLILGLFSRGHAHGATHASGIGGGTLGLVAVVATVAILAYAWVENDWTAEEVGRSIDQNAAEITADAGDVIEGAGERAETLLQNTTEEVREDTAQALDRAEDDVDPDQDNR